MAVKRIVEFKSETIEEIQKLQEEIMELNDRMVTWPPDILASLGILELVKLEFSMSAYLRVLLRASYIIREDYTSNDIVLGSNQSDLFG